MERTAAEAPAKLDIGSTSETGRRSTNQDALICRPLLGDRGAVIGVADGMGGSFGGEIASKLAADRIQEIIQVIYDRKGIRELRPVVEDLFQTISGDIRAKALEKPELAEMGTTLTVALVMDGEFFVAHVGDCRAYIVDSISAMQITDDHTLINDRKRSGEYVSPEDEARLGHVLSQCLCADAPPKVEFYPASGLQKLRPGDTLVICCDGLHGVVSTEDIGAELRKTKSAAEGATSLVDQALVLGSNDNVSLVMAHAGPWPTLKAIVKPVPIPPLKRKWTMLVAAAVVLVLVLIASASMLGHSPAPKRPKPPAKPFEDPGGDKFEVGTTGTDGSSGNSETGATHLPKPPKGRGPRQPNNSADSGPSTYGTYSRLHRPEGSLTGGAVAPSGSSSKPKRSKRTPHYGTTGGRGSGHQRHRLPKGHSSEVRHQALTTTQKPPKKDTRSDSTTGDPRRDTSDNDPQDNKKHKG